MSDSPSRPAPEPPVTRSAKSPRQALMGVGVIVAGLLIALAGLGLAYGYLFANDRILVLKPDWAEAVTLGRLLAAPEGYVERRVRVRGELWRLGPDRAVLVPTGSGVERVPVEALTAFIKDPANKGKEPPTMRPLPAKRLRLACSGGGSMKTVSFYEAAQDAGGGEVEIAGRFCRVEGPGGTPVLRAAAVVDPPQPLFRAPVQLMAGLGVGGPLVGLVLIVIGWRLAR